MTSLIVLLTFLLLVAAILGTIHAVLHDGGGHTDPPRSHAPDLFDPSARGRLA